MNSKQDEIDEKKYLVTERTDISNFSQEKITNDLESIEKAELRAKKRFDITSDKIENEITRAMDALKLNNPFRGI